MGRLTDHAPTHRQTAATPASQSASGCCCLCVRSSSPRAPPRTAVRPLAVSGWPGAAAVGTSRPAGAKAARTGPTGHRTGGAAQRQPPPPLPRTLLHHHPSHITSSSSKQAAHIYLGSTPSLPQPALPSSGESERGPQADRQGGSRPEGAWSMVVPVGGGGAVPGLPMGWRVRDGRPDCAACRLRNTTSDHHHQGAGIRHRSIHPATALLVSASPSSVPAPPPVSGLPVAVVHLTSRWSSRKKP